MAKKSEKKSKKSSKNKRNKRLVYALLFIAASAILVYFIAQGEPEVHNDFCGELGRELAKQELDCLCSEKKDIPSQYENLSIEGLCECRCFVNETWINTIVAVPKNHTNTTLNESMVSPIVSDVR